MFVNGVSVPFIPVNGVENDNVRNTDRKNTGGTSFNEVFTEELGKLRFSGHALNRMASRSVELNTLDLNRLENAVKKAEDKRALDSLVLLDDKAFIVNIPNKTVVTMFNRDTMEDNIVTKIDSAIFA